MHKDVTFATGFDLFLDSLSGLLEKIKDRLQRTKKGITGSDQDTL